MSEQPDAKGPKGACGPKICKRTTAGCSPRTDKILCLEHSHIDSVNRRTDLAIKAIEAVGASDKRYYDIEVERLRTNAEDGRQERRFMDRLVWTSSGVFILLAAFVLLMLFFGSAPQRKVASDLLRTFATGLGGSGVAWLLRALTLRTMSAASIDATLMHSSGLAGRARCLRQVGQGNLGDRLA